MPPENNCDDNLIKHVRKYMIETGATRKITLTSDNRREYSLSSFFKILENEFGKDFKYGVFYTVYYKNESGQLNKEYFGLETGYEHKPSLIKDFGDEHLVKAKRRADEFAENKTDVSVQKTYQVWFKGSPMVCIDIDNEEYIDLKDIYKNFPFLKNAPYIKGNTKGYHFFVKNDFFKNYNGSDKCLFIYDGDMKASMTFEKFDKTVYNVKNGVGIPHISKEDAQKIFDHEDILSWEKKDKKSFEQNEQKVANNNFNKDEVLDFLNNIKITPYCDKYPHWSKIVSALRNIGCPELIHDWSKKSPTKYDEYKVNRYLQNSDYRTVGFGTIKYYSKESNKDKHFQLHNKWRKSKILLDESLADDDFCKLYLEENDEIFYHPSEDNKCIFIYNKLLRIWEKVYEPKDITYYVIEKLHPILSAGLSKVEKENYKLKCKSLSKCDDCEICTQKWKLKKKAEKIEKNIFKIKSNSTQTQVAKSIIAYLKCNPNNITMDPNPHLFCWLDKSFDIKENKFVERSLEDYVTITSGYRYDDYPKCTEDKLKKLDNIFKDSLPNEHVRKCYISILRSGLIAELLPNFVCINGKGRNGKGLINKLMMHLVGNYGLTASSVILTKKIDGSKPDPSIANMHMKRFIDYSEPEEGDDAKASTIKGITGEQQLACRGLYSNKTEILNRGTHICQCNERLNIKGDVDNASMIQRYVDINFVIEFISDDCEENVDKLRECPDIYKKKVPEYDTDKFRDEYKITLFHYIINNSKPNIFIPDIVKERSKQFLESCNTILTYFYANYEKSENKNDFVCLPDIWKHYQFSEEYKNLDKKEKQLNKKKLVYEKLEKKFNILPRKEINKVEYRGLIFGYKLIEVDKLIEVGE